MHDIIEPIKNYMREDLDIDIADMTHDTLLFSEGIIDSFSLIALLTFIESTFNFRIGRTHVNLANFDSLGRMQAYIQGCIGESLETKPG